MTKKHILFICSDKGGTGKSMLSRAIADFIIRKQLEDITQLVDGDGEVGQLLQFYREHGVLSAQIIDAEKRDDFVDILKSDKTFIIVDLPAASITHLQELEKEIGFFDLLNEHNYQLTFLNVISPFKASIRSVKSMIELAGDKAKYVVIKNRFFGNDDDFHLYEESKGKKTLEQHSGLELELPSLSTGLLAIIDANNLTFNYVVTDPKMKIAYQCRMKRWLQSVDTELLKLNIWPTIENEA